MDERLLLLAFLIPALLVYPNPALRKGLDPFARSYLVLAVKVSAGGAALAGLMGGFLAIFIFPVYFAISMMVALVVGAAYLVPLVLALYNKRLASLTIAAIIGFLPGLIGRILLEGFEMFAVAAMFQGPILACLCVAKIREINGEDPLGRLPRIEGKAPPA